MEAASTFTLMMEAASTSETLVNFYQNEQRNKPDSHLHTCHHENLKYHFFVTSFTPGVDAAAGNE
jgi:hypothetical protein